MSRLRPRRAQGKESMKTSNIAQDLFGVSPKRFLYMTSGSKAQFALSALAGVVAGASQAYLLVFINRSLEDGQRNASALAVSFFGLCLLVFFSGALSVTLLSRIAQDNHYNLRLRLSRCILSTPLKDLYSCGPQRLMAVLTDDIGSIVQAQDAIPLLFVEGAKLVAALVYLGFISYKLLILVFGFLVFGLTSWHLLQRWARRWLKLAREADDALFGHYRAITEGFKELKMDARRRRAFLDRELRETANMIRTRRNKASLIYALAGRWSQSLYFLLIGAILFLPLLGEQVERESLTGFTLTVLFIGAPLAAIVNVTPALGKGVAALKNIEKLGLGAPAEADLGTGVEAIDLASTPSTLELVNVSYRYPEAEGSRGQHLGPLNLRIEPGELVFVTGGNGSGKTTLALIILGLFSPDSGEVRLGRQPITQQQRDAYRQNFSAVFADAYVFDSLLGYSNDELQARVEELLVLLQLDDKLRIENGRCSTVDLSRGQRKRLALLSAYLADRPFYLFDEWAAEQDPVFRDFFYSRMLPELKARGKTVIVITHDDRYFHMSDRLLRLTMGQIEELRPALAASA